ncbi:class IV adenylate cyclase [Candidatus Woesearchaeota archaeon]|nr:class IV adenylate cyclase [Candidatus Woesearchaeota archaeon]
MIEVELKFLDINIPQIKRKLQNIGAKLVYDQQIESHSFVKEGFHSSDSHQKYLRVRKAGDEITLTYKEPASKSDMGSREELEVKVNNYNNMITILEEIGFQKEKAFRKHRIHYELGNIKFELDTVENIPTYLEIETQTKKAMREICKRLDIDINFGKKGTIVEILPEKFISKK